MTTDAEDTAALDAWLAEHLLGWRPPGRERVDDETDRIWTGYLDPDGNLASVPKLSTTGDGMLMVLEAMRERGFYMSCGFGSVPGSYYCNVFREDLALDPMIHWEADTLPLAVSQAARAALEAKP